MGATWDECRGGSRGTERCPCPPWGIFPRGPPNRPRRKDIPPGAGGAAHPWGGRAGGGGMSQGRARGKPTSSEAAERGARKKPSLAVCLRCKITIKLTVKIFQTQEGRGKGAQMDSKCPLQARGCRTVGGEWIKVLLGAVKLEVSPPRQHEAWEEQGSAERLQNRTQSTAQRLGASRKGRGTERAPVPHIGWGGRELRRGLRPRAPFLGPKSATGSAEQTRQHRARSSGRLRGFVLHPVPPLNLHYY